MKKKRIAIAFSVCMLVCGSSIWAHHSDAVYDVSNQVTIEGVVTQVIWTNPHSLFFVEVRGENNVKKKWALEASSVNGLTKKGWTKDSLGIGNKITATGHPSRSGSPKMLLKEIITADGKKLETDLKVNFNPRTKNPEY